MNHHNHQYSGGIPLAVGDRYYGQDLGRDFNYLRQAAGLAFSTGRHSSPTLLTMGGIITQAVGANQLSIPAFGAIIPVTVTIPGDAGALIPPTTSTEEVMVLIKQSAQTVTSGISTTDLDGVTLNYIKAAISEETVYTRARAKKAGSYDYEVVDSALVYVDSVAPLSNEVCLGVLIGHTTQSYRIITFQGLYGGLGIANETIITGKPIGFLPNGKLAPSGITFGSSVSTGRTASQGDTMRIVASGAPNNEIITVLENYAAAFTINQSTGALTDAWSGPTSFTATTPNTNKSLAMVAVPDVPGRCIIVYADSTGGGLYARTVETSGGAASFGTATQLIITANVYQDLSLKWIEGSKFLVTWWDVSASLWKMAHITLSGTTPSIGTAVTLLSSSAATLYTMLDVNVNGRAMFYARSAAYVDGDVVLINTTGANPSVVDTYTGTLASSTISINGDDKVGGFLMDQETFIVPTSWYDLEYRIESDNIIFVGSFPTLGKDQSISECNLPFDQFTNVLNGNSGTTNAGFGIGQRRSGHSLLLATLAMDDFVAVTYGHADEKTACITAGGWVAMSYADGSNVRIMTTRVVGYAGVAVDSVSADENLSFVIEGSYRDTAAKAGGKYILDLHGNNTGSKLRSTKGDEWHIGAIIGSCMANGIMEIENIWKKNRDSQEFIIPFGIWDMDTTNSITLVPTLTTGAYPNIHTNLQLVGMFNYVVFVNSLGGSNRASGGIDMAVSITNIVISRLAAGAYDGSGYVGSQNCGYLHIKSLRFAQFNDR